MRELYFSVHNSVDKWFRTLAIIRCDSLSIIILPALQLLINLSLNYNSNAL